MPRCTAIAVARLFLRSVGSASIAPRMPRHASTNWGRSAFGADSASCSGMVRGPVGTKSVALSWNFQAAGAAFGAGARWGCAAAVTVDRNMLFWIIRDVT